ncbi:L,D-transpeptidase family protein [Streptomyces mesophilus]|uniref:L,D-transpeptidase family protein n=1 Tax=Streptomyces mesophilus TaxID=1775132 RepID=UPI00331A9970
MPPWLTVPQHTPSLPGAPRRPDGPFPQYRKYRDLRELEVVPRQEQGKGRLFPYCTGATGPYQKELERRLKLRPVDGRQSAADCQAVQKFQLRHGIAPPLGYAGPHTWGTAQLLHAKKHPNPGGTCPVRAGRGVACVDLSRQLMWVQRGKQIVFGPAAIRSGKPGYRTRTGTFSVYLRSAEHTSTLYNAPMPYAQFFSGGQAFHGRYRTIYYEPGSHGCVNLGYRDAERLWKVLRTGDAVFVFGRKPAAPKS